MYKITIIHEILSLLSLESIVALVFSLITLILLFLSFKTEDEKKAKRLKDYSSIISAMALVVLAINSSYIQVYDKNQNNICQGIRVKIESERIGIYKIEAKYSDNKEFSRYQEDIENFWNLNCVDLIKYGDEIEQKIETDGKKWK